MSKKFAVLCLLLFTSFSTFAAVENKFIQKVPSGWRVEQYDKLGGGDTFVIRFTDSPCVSGSIYTNNLSDKAKSKLFALILTAKTAKRPMFIFYNYDAVKGNTSCEVVSFGTDD